MENRAMEPEPGFPGRSNGDGFLILINSQPNPLFLQPDTEFKEMALVEVNRGCPRGAASVRLVLFTILFETEASPFLNRFRRRPCQRTSDWMTGTAVSDYPQLLPLCQSILSQRGEISLSSLRVDAITPSLIQCLKEGEGTPWPLP